MAVPSSNGKSAKTGARRAPTKARRGAKSAAGAGEAAARERNQVRSVAETVVDLPVGTVLGLGERIADLVEPWSGPSAAAKQIGTYRAQLRKSARRAERRGASARRKAGKEARRRRSRLESEARRRQRTLGSTLKRNREEVNERLRRTIEEQSARARELVDQVSEQIGSLR